MKKKQDQLSKQCIESLKSWKRYQTFLVLKRKRNGVIQYSDTRYEGSTTASPPHHRFLEYYIDPILAAHKLSAKKVAEQAVDRILNARYTLAAQYKISKNSQVPLTELIRHEIDQDGLLSILSSGRKKTPLVEAKIDAGNVHIWFPTENQGPHIIGMNISGKVEWFYQFNDFSVKNRRRFVAEGKYGAPALRNVHPNILFPLTFSTIDRGDPQKKFQNLLEMAIALDLPNCPAWLKEYVEQPIEPLALAVAN